jgi:rare lipoprotein A
LIRAKLIVPIAGAIAVLCSVGLSGGAAIASSRSVATGPSVVPPPAILSHRVLRANVLVGHSVSVIGSLEPNAEISVVSLERRRGHGWALVAATHNVASGLFTLRFRPRQVGAITMRVQASGDLGVIATTAAKVDVYHRVLASWYGPGGRTACGQELTAKTLGVANKTLPCGTRVTLHYRHRTVRVRVIDRGPYVAGRDYDLTYATKRALGAGDLTELWATR